MSVTELLPFPAFVLGVTLPGMCCCLWAAKKAGIRPMNYYGKFSFDICLQTKS